MYAEGDSERIIGRALTTRRAHVRIATKVGVWRKEGLSKTRVLAAIDESLQRLKTDYVDVYYLHTPDHATPITETLDAISALLTAGKIRAWGISNFAAWQLVELNALCDARSMPRPGYSQVLYNLLVRQIETEYVGCVKRFPLHTTVYNPLAGGLLARPVTADIPSGSRFDANPIYRKRYWSDRMKDYTRSLHGIAESAGIGLVALAYAWLLQRPAVSSVLAGPASVAHLEAALDAVDLELPDAVIAQVDDTYRQFVGSDASYVR
jgi:aryl-alcohol dehydrogenase-like predicted oxidoreductase